MISKFWWGKTGGLRGMGFRDFECFNDALLGKQCWRILKVPNSLVSHILRAKYFPSCWFLEADLGKCPSFIWRSMHLASKAFITYSTY